MGTLYIVATPIGNLQDITLRAIQILQSVDFIACEDTRKTGILLKSISSPDSQQRPQFISYYENNELSRIPQIMNALKNDCSVALVSDAGTPTISDPGFKLVRECIREGIKVESIPGPSSVVSSLVVSGLPTDKFLFLGYLPKKPGHRQTQLAHLKDVLKVMKSTVIILEAPHRLLQALSEIQGVFGDVEIVLARELTKIHEEVARGKISDLINKFQHPKGEFVILFNVGDNKKNE